jgi:hypothetical protein
VVGTEVKDSDLFRINQVASYFFYANGKFLPYTGPSQPIWVVSSYSSITPSITPAPLALLT